MKLWVEALMECFVKANLNFGEKLNISFHFIPVFSSVHIPDLYPRSGLSRHLRLHGDTRFPLLQHVEYLCCHEVPWCQHHLSWLHLRGCQAVRLVDSITYHQVMLRSVTFLPPVYHDSSSSIRDSRLRKKHDVWGWMLFQIIPQLNVLVYILQINTAMKMSRSFFTPALIRDDTFRVSASGSAGTLWQLALMTGGIRKHKLRLINTHQAAQKHPLKTQNTPWLLANQLPKHNCWRENTFRCNMCISHRDLDQTARCVTRLQR